MARVDRSAYRQFRAPHEDGHALIDPAWPNLPELVYANRQQIAARRYDFSGRPLAELRRAARISLLQAPNETAEEEAARPLILSGHQPELFHPGVWLKNLVLDALAKRTEGRGVNLIIDTDLCRAPSISVPTGTPAQPRVEAILFDDPAAPTPYEERGVLNRETLKRFPRRVQDTLGGLVECPLVGELWPGVLRSVDAGKTLGLAICSARHQVEARWGVRTSEAPMSSICDSPPFRWFALDLLLRLDEFQAAHNQALAEYRLAHKIRTPAQPIPDLHQQNGWLESPFWVWTTADPTRRPLYARRTGAGLLLSDLAGGEWPIELGAPGASLDAATGQIAGLREQRGVKIRSRALVTTLFARLLLADAFIHGIGGAKYDQTADRMAERFYGFAPPPHVTATATLRLPIEHAHVPPGRGREIAAELRSLEFHPERRLDSPDAAAQEIIAVKQRWIAAAMTPQNAAERHRAIRQANAALQPWVEPRRQQLLAEQQAVADLLRAATVLESREYSFCLFPEAWLRERMQRLIG